MSFAAPLILVLLPLPLFFMWVLPPRRLTSAAVAVPPAIAASFRPATHAVVHRHARLIALSCAWIALVCALAGPRQERVPDLVPVSGRDIVLALDLSGSMEREDFVLDDRTVSRLDAVKSVAGSFVRGRGGDRVGLVVFGDRAYVAASPTHDVEAVAQTIGTLRIGVSGKATAIADGLGLALRRLRERDAKSRVVILLSDGQDTTSVVDPVAAARAARDLKITIHTIALGPADLADNPGTRDAVDSETLRRIAEAASGETFRVKTTEDLKSVTEAIDRLEPSLADMPPVLTWRLYWPFPAALAVACLVLSMALHRLEMA